MRVRQKWLRLLYPHLWICLLRCLASSSDSGERKPEEDRRGKALTSPQSPLIFPPSFARRFLVALRHHKINSCMELAQCYQCYGRCPPTRLTRIEFNKWKLWWTLMKKELIGIETTGYLHIVVLFRLVLSEPILLDIFLMPFIVRLREVNLDPVYPE